MTSKITIQDLEKSIREVPDFPKKGIIFKDLTTAFKKPEMFKFMIDELYELYKNKGITKVIGVESRGFIIGAALAYKLNAGLVIIRKAGKLPAATYKETYALEYGEDTIEIHQDALDANDVVLLHDDLLATGGTASASLRLIDKFGVKEKYAAFLMELTFLDGRNILEKNCKDVFSLVHVK